MREINITIPELALIAGTRAFLGVGLGLLLAGRLSEPQRRAAGLTLLVVGALTTVPLAAEVLNKGRTRTEIPADRSRTSERTPVGV